MVWTKSEAGGLSGGWETALLEPPWLIGFVSGAAVSGAPPPLDACRFALTEPAAKAPGLRGTSGVPLGITVPVSRGGRADTLACDAEEAAVAKAAALCLWLAAM